jgi:hypothetical protein
MSDSEKRAFITIVVGDSASAIVREVRKLNIPGGFHCQFPECMRSDKELLAFVQKRFDEAIPKRQPLLIATLSELAVIRAQNLIKFGKISRDDLRVLEAMDRADGCHEHRFDEDGDSIDSWLYFDTEARFREVFAHEDALLKEREDER